MELEEAKKILADYNKKLMPTEADEKLYVDTLNYLISVTESPEYQAMLGSYYFERKEFEQALEYYLVAAEANNKEAVCGLAYIYYYGMCGEPDYKLALHYYKRASQMGVDAATIQVAEMYAKGLGIKKNVEEAKKILTDLYERTKNTDLIYSIYPEVVIKLSNYWLNDKKYDDAFNALTKAKDFIKSRLVYDSSFLEYENMEKIISLIYKCVDFNRLDMDIYDIIYYFKKEGNVSFVFNNKKYDIKGEKDGNSMAIEFNGKWYQDVRSFILNAKINNERIASLAYFITEVYGE